MARHHFLTAGREPAPEAPMPNATLDRPAQPPTRGLQVQANRSRSTAISSTSSAASAPDHRIDGGQHTPERDAPRTAYHRSVGFRVMRFWNNDVLQNRTAFWTMIEEAARIARPLTRPAERATLSLGRGEGLMRRSCRSSPIISSSARRSGSLTALMITKVMWFVPPIDRRSAAAWPRARRGRGTAGASPRTPAPPRRTKARSPSRRH